MSPPLPPPLANLHENLLSHPQKLPALPDLFLTALSVCFLFTSSTKSNFAPRCPFLSFPLNPRRFLKIPAMSHSASNQKLNLLPRRHNFVSPQSLSEWLKPRLPSDSFASWGVKPGTKNVHNLWLEISEGETSLADSTPPVRTVQVVTVRVIGKDGKVLVESHQELSDGNVRKRGRPLSEKMKPSEDPESAAVRAIKEELGSVILGSDSDLDVCEIVRIDPDSYEMKVEERSSDSYPGLPGLPEGDFCTFEVDEYGNFDGKNVAEKAVSVKKHYWTWVSTD
ncbi:putative NUDIX hydrolase domain-containing protein [Senna tora]|uniref:Putative NUDIX hydrolase domain-containing protein n=1 Tax=Senna tora TaxID=362788 RepID=A0A834WGW9_9FABA|nr:putative NUDIX hydrolase domain-containing protein [Senna tora]